jgi:pimeloyl-ACP methyl ester carboxylesterase
VSPATLDTLTARLSDGRTLAYVAAGDPHGAPVVAHHGTPGSRLFAALLDDAARAAGVRLLVPDRPGYGRSSPPPETWSWDAWREDVRALLDAESVDRAGVLGFSGGGPFAAAAADTGVVTRLALVSTVVPPAEGGLAARARHPLALRALFRLSGVLIRLAGPSLVVGQYTDRDVAGKTADAVEAEFREALRQGARAPVGEAREFGTGSVDSDGLSVPVRGWHGAADENAPLDHVEAFVGAAGGEVTVCDADHLGTLLDSRRAAFGWLAE